MRKIALFICGRATCYDIAFTQFLEVMKMKHIVDVYISANYYDDDLQKNIQPVIYETKSYTLCPNLEKSLILGKNVKSIYNICSMYHHKKVIFEKVANDYDVYMYFRTDLKNAEKLKFPEKLKGNTVYLPDDHDCQGVNDRMAYGDYDSMSKYMNIDISKHKVVLPELILKNHLKSNGVKIERIKWDTHLQDRVFRRQINILSN